MSDSFRRFLKLSFKLAFVSALFYFLAKRGFISIEATGRAFSQWKQIGIAFLSLFFTAILGVIRWQWLLRPQNIHLKWTRTLQLAFIGNFFNIALPGAVSGDFVKAFYVAKEVQGLRGRAFGSILFDRVVGLSALVLVSAGAMFLDYGFLKETALVASIRVLLFGAACVVVAFYSYLFLVREQHDPLLRLFRGLESRIQAAGSFTRIYEGIRHYQGYRGIVARVLVISIAIHLLVGFSCIQFALALGVGNLEMMAIFVVVPLGLLVTAVPIMPAGIGTGHAAFGWLFHFLGTQRGADIFSLYALVQLTIGAIGGLVYLRFRGRETGPVLDPFAA